MYFPSENIQIDNSKEPYDDADNYVDLTPSQVEYEHQKRIVRKYKIIKEYSGSLLLVPTYCICDNFVSGIIHYKGSPILP